MEPIISTDEDVYAQNGYEDREDYLNSLAEEKGIDRLTVDMIADMLGETEDFDGLISTLDDYKRRLGGSQ